jgi:hypothetical protein
VRADSRNGTCSLFRVLTLSRGVELRFWTPFEKKNRSLTYVGFGGDEEMVFRGRSNVVKRDKGVILQGLAAFNPPEYVHSLQSADTHLIQDNPPRGIVNPTENTRLLFHNIWSETREQTAEEADHIRDASLREGKIRIY